MDRYRAALLAAKETEKKIKALTESENGDENESVLACGKIVPDTKNNCEVSAASLWLKGKRMILHLFEYFKKLSNRQWMSKSIKSCPVEELEGTNTAALIPKHETIFTFADEENWKDCAKNETANEPGSDAVDVYRFKIVSISPIVGVVAAYSLGIIQACSTDLAEYLFGTIEGTVIPESAFRHTAILLKSTYSNDVSSTKLSTSPCGPSGITTVHRDGTEFSVDIQMRVVEYADEPLRALWITYDRSL
ncbi:3417_t:CDS:2, partial [Paraglomus occultum]